MPLRDAALDLVRTFGLEPAPASGTEKRHGYYPGKELTSPERQRW
jgi:hypothetical protein